VEWDDVVRDSESVVQNYSLVKIVEDVNILHEQFIEPDLGKARNIGFTDDSCSEIDLANRGQVVFFKLGLVGLLFFLIEVHVWVWQGVDSLVVV
jgi:hypothetical protein